MLHQATDSDWFNTEGVEGGMLAEGPGGIMVSRKLAVDTESGMVTSFTGTMIVPADNAAQMFHTEHQQLFFMKPACGHAECHKLTLQIGLN